MEPMRLQRFLSQAGVAARRKGEQMIVAGRVSVNGKTVTELGSKVDPAKDTVRVDGVAVEPQSLVYLVLNKPKGTVTTVSDPQGRPTVMDLVPDLGIKIAPVGRLDFYTEGVLLLTNDGELAAGLLGPRTVIEKTYHVKIQGKVKPEHLEKWRTGVMLDDDGGGRRATLPAKVDVLKNTGAHMWLVVSITEGRSRQIHRTAEALGYSVLKLQRVAFAGITFHGLKIGEVRRLSEDEVKTLRKLAGLAEKEGRLRAEPAKLIRPTKVAVYPGGGDDGAKKGAVAIQRVRKKEGPQRSQRGKGRPQRPSRRF